MPGTPLLDLLLAALALFGLVGTGVGIYMLVADVGEYAYALPAGLVFLAISAVWGWVRFRRTD